MQTLSVNHRYNGWQESAKLATFVKTAITDMKRIWYDLQRADINLDDNITTLMTSLVQSATQDYAGIVSSARMQKSFITKINA